MALSDRCARRSLLYSSGHVWQGRFRSFPIQEDPHLWTVQRYIERNPVRARVGGAASGLVVVERRARAAGDAAADGRSGDLTVAHL